MGADFVFSAGTLFIAKFALPHEQSVSGALFNTMTQLGTAVGVTVSTVVFNSVARKAVPENKDPIFMYKAAQWTTLAFGVIGKVSLSFSGLMASHSAYLATILGIIAFRGVGAVGTREPALTSPEEACGSVEKIQHDTAIDTMVTSSTMTDQIKK